MVMAYFRQLSSIQLQLLRKITQKILPVESTYSSYQNKIPLNVGQDVKLLCQPAQQCAHVQQYHTKLAKKLCNTIFILLWIYYTILGTYSQDNWMDVLDTSFSYFNLHKLKQPCTREKQEHLSPSYTSFNVVHVATCSLFQEPKTITPKLSPMHGIFEGSKEMEIRGSEIWAVWWVDRNSLSELSNCFLCF